jgi:hypothetical protein
MMSRRWIQSAGIDPRDVRPTMQIDAMRGGKKGGLMSVLSVMFEDVPELKGLWLLSVFRRTQRKKQLSALSRVWKV